MKKIISFKKDLLFNTKISEITSISLEHKIMSKTEELVSGEFYINGDYKIIDGNINREKFNFNLPFDIALSNKFIIKDLLIDVDDFRYEIINNDTLKVNIDVSLEGEEKEELLEKEIVKEHIIEDIIKEEDLTRSDNIVNDFMEQEFKEDSQIEKINLFDNLETTETYVTYHVYIMKENDTIEGVLDKYKITKENLENYNDLSSIKPGSKLIIPALE